MEIYVGAVCAMRRWVPRHHHRQNFSMPATIALNVIIVNQLGSNWCVEHCWDIWTIYWRHLQQQKFPHRNKVFPFAGTMKSNSQASSEKRVWDMSCKCLLANQKCSVDRCDNSTCITEFQRDIFSLLCTPKAPSMIWYWPVLDSLKSLPRHRLLWTTFNHTCIIVIQWRCSAC